jgi:hypothetical protein
MATALEAFAILQLFWLLPAALPGAAIVVRDDSPSATSKKTTKEKKEKKKATQNMI